MPAGICTSTTRPQTPQIGDRIFETDTGNLLYWYGPYFKWMPQWGCAGGLLGQGEMSGLVSGAATAITVRIPYLLAQGRKLMWVANFTGGRPTASGSFQITDENLVVKNERALNIPPNTALAVPVTIIHREDIPLTQQTDVVRLLRVLTGYVTGQFYNLFCFDEGPNINIAGDIPTWGTAIWNSNVWGN